MFDEEESLIVSTKTEYDEVENVLRPKSMEGYVGQEKAKTNLSVFMQSAKLRGEPLDHVLLYGPPGLGKTTLAHIIAAEMGVRSFDRKIGRPRGYSHQPQRGRRSLYRRNSPS